MKTAFGSPCRGYNFAITSNEVSNRLNMLAVRRASIAATYRNLKFDYGYSMDLSKGVVSVVESAETCLQVQLPYTTKALHERYR